MHFITVIERRIKIFMKSADVEEKDTPIAAVDMES